MSSKGSGDLDKKEVESDTYIEQLSKNLENREKVSKEAKREYTIDWIKSGNNLYESVEFTEIEEISSTTSERIGTRSQVGLKHTEIAVEKKPRKPKSEIPINKEINISLSLTEALHLIPKYSGKLIYTLLFYIVRLS